MPRAKRNSFLPLTGSQLLGLVILLLLLAATISVLYYVDYRTATPDDDDVIVIREATDLIGMLEKDTFEYEYQPRQKVLLPELNLHPFDPNTADSVTLLEEGFKPWQASLLLRYRANGGRYKDSTSLRRHQWLSEELYRQIQPYIDIYIDTTLVDTFHLTFNYPLKKDTILELNTCDTTELQLLRGIGAYTAKQIVFYRERLGGYVSVEQLQDIEILKDKADSLYRHFTVDTTLIVRINVNTENTARLRMHPYLRYEQAKAIYELRRHKVQLHSIEELRSLDCLTDEEIRRLRPYLSFDLFDPKH